MRSHVRYISRLSVFGYRSRWCRAPLHGIVGDLEYADNIVLLTEDPGGLQDLLCSLDKFAAIFGMRFAPPKCKMMLQNWVEVTPNLSIKGQFTERVEKFT